MRYKRRHISKRNYWSIKRHLLLINDVRKGGVGKCRRNFRKVLTRANEFGVLDTKKVGNELSNRKSQCRNF
jgi:hypothetical protein